MEKKKKAVITVVTVILILVILLIVFRPGLIKRLTGEVSSVNTNNETEVISNEFINEVCNISVDNENFMTIDGTIIMDEGEDGVATVNVVSGDLVFTKEVTVKSNDYTSFTYVLPRGEYDLRIEKEGYKTYETKVLESKNLNVTLVANKNKDIIASSKTFYNTYYDYYSDGTIHLKTVGNFNMEEEMDPDFFYFVLGDALTKYVSNNGLDIKPVSTGGQYDGLVLMMVSMIYSVIASGQEFEGINYRYQFIDANNKIENKECREDNYLTDENCENVKIAYDFLGYANSEVSFDDTVKLVKLIIDMPVPTKVIINDDVQVLPSLAYVVSDEIKINENVMFVSDYTLQNAKIGTLIINSSAINETSVFASNSKINNLIIGNRVTKISNNAFSDSEINNISLPETLTQIGESAFENTKMNAIKLPDNIKSIGKRAFRNCGITEVKLPKKIESIGERAFDNNSITNILIPGKLTNIESYAFSENKLTSITVPNSITNLGDYVFSDNELNEVYWDTNASTYQPFSSNQSENVKLTIGPNVSTIKNIFYGLKLSELNLSYGVEKIENYAFRNQNLTSLVLPESIKSIGYSAFSDNKITSITIPAGVTEIGSDAFNNNKITSITIPNSVTDIGNNAFGSNNLDTIYFNALNIKTMSNAFSGNKSSGCTLIISEGVKSIPNSAFSGAKIVNLTIPSSVTSIGKYAFSNNLLTELPSLPSSIKNIGNGWFMSNKLTNVVIPHGIESIDSYAFKNNEITNVLIPNTVTRIGNYAFDSNRITSIVIPESVETIENYAFTSNSFSEITIMGNQTRFNSNWNYIGFPASLKPSE